MIFLFGILLVSFSSAVSVNNCCERTIGGAICQNAEPSQCDSNYQNTPTSCEQTAYCSTGTCIDTKEGLCLEGYTQKTCEESVNGFFEDKSIEELPQCQIGCCFYGDNSEPTTQTRCSALASQFGYEVNYRRDMTDQLECIAATGGEEEGACVYEKIIS